MARRCDECDKGALTGHNVSHSKRRTKRKFFPNLHVATMIRNGIKSRVKLCTRCLRTLKKKGLVVDRRKTVEKTPDTIPPAAVV